MTRQQQFVSQYFTAIKKGDFPYEKSPLVARRGIEPLLPE